MQREFISGLSGLRRSLGTAVVTIGSFDGVHLGHQQILKRVIQRADKLKIASAVVIFEPQPHEYFAKLSAPEHARSAPIPRIMRLRDKVNALFAMGVSKVVCLRFNTALRSLTAEEFVDSVLIHGLQAKHLEIGDDFRFGCDRRGDFALLQALGAQHGFSVANSQTYLEKGERISSTRVRAVLAANQLELASELLGKPYSLQGRVIYGRQLGRTIGVPTANIGLGQYAAAVSGVYAVRAELAGVSYCGVANVGVKPTLEGEHKAVLEVHLFEFNAVIYGECLTVEFCKALRDEQKFASFDALKQQIEVDIKNAKKYFAALE